MSTIPAIKDIVKDNFVFFRKFRQGFFYYNIWVNRGTEEEERYIFPVPQSDIGDATLEHTDKAIIFMRYIRKALEEGTFIKA